MSKLCPINAWLTSLDGDINDSVTSITLLNAVPTDDGPVAGDYLWVFAGSEIIRLTIPSPASSKTFVAARGRDGTTAAAHDDGTPVIVGLTREAVMQLRDDAVAIATALSQPLDATLTALAGANWQANSLAIGTGADAVGQVTFTTNTFPARASSGNLVAKPISDFGLSLVDDADAVAARTTLGLHAVAASGAYSDLTGKPSLGTAAVLDFDDDPTLATDDDDHVPTVAAVKEYIDDAVAGAGTGSVTSVGVSVPSFLAVSGSPITSTGTIAITAHGSTADGELPIGRSSDHTYVRTTLTAGYMSSVTNGSGSITLALATPLTVDTDGATVTFDLASSNSHQVTLGGNRTLALSNVSTGKKFLVTLIEDATGGRTVTWWSGITWFTATGSDPTLDTTANAINMYGFICVGSGAYIGFDLKPQAGSVAGVLLATNNLSDLDDVDEAVSNLGLFAPESHDFSSSGTVTIPDGATMMEAIVIGGGGGAGSGRRGNAATNRIGGSGGSGAGFTHLKVSVADIGGAGTGLTVTVGTGGAGGAAITADDTNGNAGSDGVDSSITRTSDSEVIAYSSRGMGGAGGIESASTSAVTGVTSSTMFNGGTGGGSRPDATATAGSNSGPSGGGGGGGGGISSSATSRAGGNGGAGGRAWRGASTNAAGGTATGVNGTAATTPTFAATPGGGGGGGGAGTGVGGTGGVGKRGGGGGGGAAAANGNNSGAGGNGGDGFIRIIFS